MKKFLATVLLGIMLITSLLTFTACRREYRTEYFRYHIWGSGATKTISIIGLTKLGSEQRFLVVPEKIHGIKVTQISDRTGYMSNKSVEWKSEVLEKIFFTTYDINIYLWTIATSYEELKVFAIDFKEDSIVSSNSLSFSSLLYYCYISKPIYAIYKEIWHPYIFTRTRMANITYLYNYETEINYGCYWIDDVEYGGLIEFVPPNPSREGYTFGGWYKEAGCINKWSFETDRLPASSEYLELYAKWI